MIPTRSYALVLVQNGDRFVLVQETGKEWYLPAGRVEPGETFFEAAVRETREEAGCEVELTGIWRIEHSPSRDRARLRVVFSGRPKHPEAPLKDFADMHSSQAKWFTFDEAVGLTFRGDDVLALLEFVRRGGQPYPLGLLTQENDPWPGAKA